MSPSSNPSRRALLAALPLAAAFAAHPAAVAQTAPSLPTLRIGVTPSDGFGEAYYGHDMGFFSDAGINLDVQTLPGEGTILPAVVGGTLDIGISTPMTMASARLRGLQLDYIAGGAIYLSAAPTQGLIVAKNNPIRSAKEFEGATLAVVGIRDGTHLALAAWLAHEGADVSKVKFIEVGRAAMIASTEQGTIAGGILGEPFLSVALGTTCRLFGKPYDIFGDRALLGGYYATPDVIKNNTPLLRRFVGAMYRTATWANANHPRSAEILQKYTQISDTAVKTMRRVTYGTSLDPRSIQPTLDVAFASKFIDAPVNAVDLIQKL